MKLNCKAGDLAIVVSGQPVSNIGRVIRVVEISTAAAGMYGIWCWLYEGQLTSFTGAPVWCIADECLRPIRGGDGEDQTLTWAGKPSDIKTPEPTHA